MWFNNVLIVVSFPLVAGFIVFEEETEFVRDFRDFRAALFENENCYTYIQLSAENTIPSNMSLFADKSFLDIFMEYRKIVAFHRIPENANRLFNMYCKTRNERIYLDRYMTTFNHAKVGNFTFNFKEDPTGNEFIDRVRDADSEYEIQRLSSFQRHSRKVAEAEPRTERTFERLFILLLVLLISTLLLLLTRIINHFAIFERLFDVESLTAHLLNLFLSCFLFFYQFLILVCIFVALKAFLE